MKLTTVRKAIKTKNATWTAGETSRSGLSSAELRVGQAGVQADDRVNELAAEMFRASNELQKRIEELAEIGEPDPRFSWLSAVDNRGLPVVTPAKDQSPDDRACNSCVAFAIVGAIEARMNILARQQAGEVNLSEGFLFFGGCGFCCENGWTIAGGLAAAKDGIPTEDAFPYDPDPGVRPGPATPVVRVARSGKIANEPDIKRIIQAKGPLVAEMMLFEDFTAYCEGVYEHVAGKELGAHAVSIIGYDDAPENGDPPHWICKNSWGTAWGFGYGGSRSPGDGGFFKIRYGECGIVVGMPVFDFDIELELSLQEAADALNQILESAEANSELKKCLRDWFRRPPFARKRCKNIAMREIVEIADDILKAYPALKPQFKEALK